MIRILYLDDSDILLRVVKCKFEKTGTISVDTCRSVDDALSMISRADYDVIITDYLIPITSGNEFLQKLEVRQKKIPSIIYSVLKKEEIQSSLFEGGNVGFVNKEYGFDEQASPFDNLENMVRMAASGLCIAM